TPPPGSARASLRCVPGRIASVRLRARAEMHFLLRSSTWQYNHNAIGDKRGMGSRGREEIMQRKIAIVTGASSGIGEATAERLAKAGYKVYGTSRRGAPDGKRSFQMLRLDVTSDESVEAAVREVIQLEGRIDLLVNNAGFGTAPAGAEE